MLCGEAVKAEPWKPHELSHPTAPGVAARGRAGRLNTRVECVDCARTRIGSVSLPFISTWIVGPWRAS